MLLKFGPWTRKSICKRPSQASIPHAEGREVEELRFLRSRCIFSGARAALLPQQSWMIGVGPLLQPGNVYSMFNMTGMGPQWAMTNIRNNGGCVKSIRISTSPQRKLGNQLIFSNCQKWKANHPRVLTHAWLPPPPSAGRLGPAAARGAAPPRLAAGGGRGAAAGGAAGNTLGPSRILIHPTLFTWNLTEGTVVMVQTKTPLSGSMLIGGRVTSCYSTCAKRNLMKPERVKGFPRLAKMMGYYGAVEYHLLYPNCMPPKFLKDTSKEPPAQGNS